MPVLRMSRLAAGRHGVLSVLGVLLVWPAAVLAYSSYGLGALDCSTYLERRAEDQRDGTMQNTSYIHTYLNGYLTAGNMLHGLVGDHAKDVALNVHTVVQWLDARCLERPDQRVAVALENFWVEAAEAKRQLRAREPQR